MLRIHHDTGFFTHHNEIETCEVSGNDFTDYVAVSLWDLEIILKGGVPMQKRLFHWRYQGTYLCVEPVDLGLQSAATEGPVHPILFLFTFVSIISLLQLARQHIVIQEVITLYSYFSLPENCLRRES